MSSLQDMGVTPATLTRLNKLGIRTPLDLILHLPLRYDDETRIVQIRDLLYGQTGCLEVEVMDAEVQYRPKRTLRVRVQDASGELTLRFLNFYGSHQGCRPFAANPHASLSHHSRFIPSHAKALH